MSRTLFLFLYYIFLLLGSYIILCQVNFAIYVSVHYAKKIIINHVMLEVLGRISDIIFIMMGMQNQNGNS